ncbi:hypothetical protein QYF36_013998 [Acer negundo]|nr:hypothetical protein QYF36_013998 [Acer negundo]
MQGMGPRVTFQKMATVVEDEPKVLRDLLSKGFGALFTKRNMLSTNDLMKKGRVSDITMGREDLTVRVKQGRYTMHGVWRRRARSGDLKGGRNNFRGVVSRLSNCSKSLQQWNDRNR